MTPERLMEIRAYIREYGTMWAVDLLATCDELAARVEKLSDLEGEVACATDKLNCWARESCVAECKDYFAKLALRGVVDRLWSRNSGKMSELAAENECLRRANRAWLNLFGRSPKEVLESLPAITDPALIEALTEVE